MTTTTHTTATTSRGSYRLLTTLLYANLACIEVDPQWGVVRVRSIRKLARLLGTEARRIRGFLGYLEASGYVSNLNYSTNGRGVQMRIRKPRNVR
jgi:hypothetical protein